MQRRWTSLIFSLFMLNLAACDQAGIPANALRSLPVPVQEVVRGGKTSGNVVFVNQSGRSVRIDRLSATCGCTLIENEAASLKPGESLSRTFTCSASNASGPQSVRIHAFVGQHAISTAVIKVTVVDPLPTEVEWSSPLVLKLRPGVADTLTGIDCYVSRGADEKYHASIDHATDRILVQAPEHTTTLDMVLRRADADGGDLAQVVQINPSSTVTNALDEKSPRTHP